MRIVEAASPTCGRGTTVGQVLPVTGEVTGPRSFCPGPGGSLSAACRVEDTARMVRE